VAAGGEMQPSVETQSAGGEQVLRNAAENPTADMLAEMPSEEAEPLPFGASTQPALNEADVTCVTESLRQALAAPAAELDPYTLSRADMEAVLEQEELCQELKTLDLSGLEALAYVLMAKLGSLARAFAWFDTHRKGKFSTVVWDTGMVLLKIDLEKLTGFKPSQVFSMMDGNPSNGFVSRKEWNRFFGALEEGSLTELLKKAAEEKGTIVERAKRRVEKLEKDRPAPPEKATKRGKRRPSVPSVQQGSRQGAATDSGGQDDARQQEAEDLFRERARKALATLTPGEALTYASDTFTKWQSDDQAEAGPMILSGEMPDELLSFLLPEEKCDIVEELAEDMDLWVLSC
ncbi:tmcA, partial [Symbiodinium pilosum]